jgi:shikimate dehydrogenase
MLNAPDRYAVFGHPIGHSQSPRIHTLFAEQTAQHLVYFAQDVERSAFEQEASAFFLDGGLGLNCTIPLKEAAFQLADLRSSRAERSGAVNTLALREDGIVFGDNTDGIGLLRDLTVNLGLHLTGKKILLLGAGGASRGVLAPLLEANPACLVIANRTPDKARLLADQFAELGSVSACGFRELGGRRFDLVLNATAASLSGELPPLPDDLLAPDSCCYDLAYGGRPTPFVLWGKAHGAAISTDGIGMLVEQAAEGFFLWRGIRPETAPVIQTLNADRAYPPEIARGFSAGRQ